MVDEYISKSKALEEIKSLMPKMIHGDDRNFGEQSMNAQIYLTLRDMPAAKVTHGKWIWIVDDKYMCKNCGRITHVDECMGKPMYKCCPYCRALMDLER